MAWDLFRHGRLSAKINQLRREGYPILSIRGHEVISRYGQRGYPAAYKLDFDELWRMAANGKGIDPNSASAEAEPT